MAEQRLEVAAGVLDPVRHGVGADELGSVELPQHALLEARMDVAEEADLGSAVRLGELRLELGEHVELEVERVA